MSGPPTDATGYRRPRAGQRDRYSQTPTPDLAELSTAMRQPGAVPTVEEAIHALLRHHATDWAITTRRNARHYLLLGRWPEFCRVRGIDTIHLLRTQDVEDFLVDVSTVLKAETVVKYRTYLRALARFCAATPGFGGVLADIDRIPVPRTARRKMPVALTRDQEAAIVAAAKPGRDRLIVEVLLACGLRVGELSALLVSDLNLTNRPAFVRVRGNYHNRDITKGREDRNAPFRSKYPNLPRELGDFLRREDSALRAGGRQEVFLSQVRDGQGRARPLTPTGVQQLMERLTRQTGIHVSPHMLRHTWATRSVEAGVPVFHLQQAGGWQSIEMVRRYYTADAREMLEAFARAHE
jgi:integrase